ncbi:MAG: ribosome-associated translation inhibitor RaiA [Planctomycetes bacterium]|nr:ribosome-associated translation inhibitor RaiA [Planctomycetota bacterium]
MNHRGQVSIEVTSRHGHVSQRMEDYATEKALKLPRFNDQISRIEIIVDGPHEAPEVEMVVHIDNHPNIVASQTSEHFHAAIDGLVDKVERQLKRAKERLKSRRADTNSRGGAEPTGGGDGGGEETYDDVLRRDLGA